MRFYFDISGRLPIRCKVGRDFKLVSEAVVYAKYLAAALRCLEPDIRPGYLFRSSAKALSRSTKKLFSLRLG
jgi:hypothetical protein